MSEMKIELANESNLRTKPFGDTICGKEISVVRLEAVDALIAEAAWAMEIVAERSDSGINTGIGPLARAKAFLDSQTVADWRKRQEGRKV